MTPTDTDDEEESKSSLACLIIRESDYSLSHFIRCPATFTTTAFSIQDQQTEYLKKKSVSGTFDIGKSAIIRRLGEGGSLTGVLTTDLTKTCEELFRMAKQISIAGKLLTSGVSGAGETRDDSFSSGASAGNDRQAFTFKMVAFDQGYTASIVKRVKSYGCKITVVPFKRPPTNPDGVILSNRSRNLFAGPHAAQRVKSFPAGNMEAGPSTSGVLITVAHFFLAAGAVVLLDFYYLRQPFVLILPFLVSAALAGFLGYLVIPFLKYLKARQILRLEGPKGHFVKFGTPTMGGLFFVPVGVTIAGIFTGFSSSEVHCATIVTLAFAGIGMVDDNLAIRRKHNYGLKGWFKLTLQVFIGVILHFWLGFCKISPANEVTQNAVWFPKPFGVVTLGKWYLPLTAFCCAAMSNGVNLSDGLDGLAGGTAAHAFIAMSAASLPQFRALGVFGSSMAGACFGFLLHNRHKAKVFMGDTGSLAIGGALAAMACLTGMFVPLFIASGVFVIETLSVMGQVLYFKLTRRLYGTGRRWLRMAPFHHHLELVGFKEPRIVAMAYCLSLSLASLAAVLVLTKS